jgi:ABC-type spermidine/putrescine transport system permease subunit II
MSSSLFLAFEPIVTWIKVDKPSFDLVGVVLSSFRLAGILLVLALALGLLLGGALLRSRRRTATPLDSVSLHLDTRA